MLFETIEPRLMLSSYTISNLASFAASPNGSNPRSTLVADSTGDLFGTTYGGGANNDGTVFEMGQSSTAITTVATFNGTNGANPYAGVMLDSSGDLFGTTSGGGGSGDGTVFEIAHGSTTITTLASFNGTNGANPYASVTLNSSGALFGTTVSGGGSGVGTVFEVAAHSTSITTLASFTGTNGSYTFGGVSLDSAGDLFGTTFAGGTGGEGTVFEIPAGGTSVNTLASFNGANGSFPYDGVALDPAGDLFGTTYSGGVSGNGTVFELPSGGTSISTLASFNGNNGQEPYAGVSVDASGNLFGTTYNGAGGQATVFEVANGSATITTLATFNGGNGANPFAGVYLDGGGDLFGTANMGGANGVGTVYELVPGTSVTAQINGVTYGTSTTLTGILDAGTSPLANQTVTFQLPNGMLLGTGVTNSSGVATASWVDTLPPGNYTFRAVFGGNANNAAAESAPVNFTVLAKSLSVSITGGSKTYDGTTAAAVTYVLAGLVPGDLVTATGRAAFVSPNVGTGIQVNATGIALGGPAGADYVLSNTTAMTTANITDATPVVLVTAPNGGNTGLPHPATASLIGAGGTAVPSLEGVTPTLTYYSGSTASGPPLGGAPVGLGTYTVVASFAGSQDYSPASSAPLTFTIVPGVAASLVSTQVGDGSAQRSTISSFTVVFNEKVNFTAASYTLKSSQDDKNWTDVSSGVVATNPSGDGETWVFACKPGGTLDRTGSKYKKGFFVNGIYQLTLHGSAITDAATGTAQYNGGSDQIVSFNDGVGTSHAAFAVLFGDLAGIGTVNNADVQKFNMAFATYAGQTGYIAALDYDAIGFIDNLDAQELHNDFEGVYQF